MMHVSESVTVLDDRPEWHPTWTTPFVSFVRSFKYSPETTKTTGHGLSSGRPSTGKTLGAAVGASPSHATQGTHVTCP